MSRGRKKKRTSLKGNAKYIALVLIAIATVCLVVVAMNQMRTPPASAPRSPVIAAPTAPPSISPERPVVAFIGDSFTAGTGSTSPEKRFSSLVADEMGWDEINLGRGGTGFITTSGVEGCGLEYCPTYGEMIADAVAAQPAIVFVSGGGNDQAQSLQQINQAVAAFYTDLRAALPDAQIIAISPFWRDTTPPPSIADVHEAVEVNVARVGGVFIDIGQPLAGQQEAMADIAHPNDVGHGLLARAIVERSG